LDASSPCPTTNRLSGHRHKPLGIYAFLPFFLVNQVYFGWELEMLDPYPSILPSSSQKSDISLDFYCFVTWLPYDFFIFEDWCELWMYHQKVISKRKKALFFCLEKATDKIFLPISPLCSSQSIYFCIFFFRNEKENSSDRMSRSILGTCWPSQLIKHKCPFLGLNHYSFFLFSRTTGTGGNGCLPG
jgi:hypothetical protein